MTVDPKQRRALLARLDKATAAHERTRTAVDDAVADCRAAGIALTDIAEHSPYSREWVRRIAASVLEARSKEGSDAPPQ
jgi:hypothetical protein